MLQKQDTGSTGRNRASRNTPWFYTLPVFPSGPPQRERALTLSAWAI